MTTAALLIAAWLGWIVGGALIVTALDPDGEA